MESLWNKLDETYRQIQPAQERPEDTFLLGEFADRFQISRNSASRRIKTLHRLGKIQPVSFALKKINGAIQVVQGWQLVEQARQEDNQGT